MCQYTFIYMYTVKRKLLYDTYLVIITASHTRNDNDVDDVDTKI